MKKMIKLMAMVACMCAVFGIAGCGGNSPDAVVLDFLKTMQSGKADEAYLKANCTESAAKMLTLGLAMAKDEMMKNMEGVKFSVADTKIDGDKATVTVKMEGGKKDKDGKAGKEEEKFDLKKVDGKWKIDFNKEDSMKDKKGTNAA